MPSLKDQCEHYFGCTDFYEVLRISKTADDKQIRKAYHRLSLIIHPDRVEENKKLESTEKFKILGKVHDILSDKEKRAVYDETGNYDEEEDTTERDWLAYWRRLFKKITIEDITKYEQQYKGSEEELKDLKKAYVNGKGDLDFILEAVPFTHTEEEPRLRELLQPFIDSGELPTFRAFTHESPKKRDRRKRKWEKEAEEASRMKEELGLEDDDDDSKLAAMIERRQQERVQFLDALATKYAPKKKGKAATANGATRGDENSSPATTKRTRRGRK